mmetsp:Transcript_20976/g.29555  ORF Transcript_20976/g.29555 Transcript_20976/m.29555 type:complete len:96 (+) Transcript_20976:86-373(+)
MVCSVQVSQVSHDDTLWSRSGPPHAPGTSLGSADQSQFAALSLTNGQSEIWASIRKQGTSSSLFSLPPPMPPRPPALPPLSSLSSAASAALQKGL